MFHQYFPLATHMRSSKTLVLCWTFQDLFIVLVSHLLINWLNQLNNSLLNSRADYHLHSSHITIVNQKPSRKSLKISQAFFPPTISTWGLNQCMWNYFRTSTLIRLAVHLTLNLTLTFCIQARTARLLCDGNTWECNLNFLSRPIRMSCLESTH